PFPSRTVPLTEEGRGQARALAELLRDVPLDRAIVSKLRRTRETAAIVLDGRGVPAEESELLSEIRTGRLRDIPEARLEEAFVGAFGPKITRRSRFLAGEAFGPFLERVERGLDELLADEGWRSV